jgi:hypothetical protein
MSRMGLEAGFALLAVVLHPLGQGAQTHAHFASYLLGGEAFFQAELNRFAPDLIGVGANVRPASPPRRPPRGAGSPLPLLNFLDAFHR